MGLRRVAPPAPPRFKLDVAERVERERKAIDERSINDAARSAEAQRVRVKREREAERQAVQASSEVELLAESFNLTDELPQPPTFDETDEQKA